MILEIDIGNTRVKWRIVTGSKIIFRGTQSSQNVLRQGRLAINDQYLFSQVRLCCVAGSALESLVCGQLAADFDIPIFIARVSRVAGPVKCGYKNPKMLGIDRWLGILACYASASRDFVVVDAGTAMTIDVVKANGLHLGGYICPGQALLRNSLNSVVQKLRVSALQKCRKDSAPVSTEEAILRGCLMSSVALIERICGEEPRDLYITGGDAMSLLRELSLEANFVEDLVLDGLSATGLNFEFF